MFQEFPKCLVQGDQCRVVLDQDEEESARVDGFVFHDEIEPENEPKKSGRKPKAD